MGPEISHDCWSVGLYLGYYDMTTINMGFESFPYPARYQARSPVKLKGKMRFKPRSVRAYGANRTTKEVSQEIESKYHVVETFSEMEGPFIVDLIEGATVDAIEAIIEGRIPSLKIQDSSTKEIEQRFRDNLDSRRYDGVISGVPTLAAQRGVDHTQHRPYAKRGPRPSFVDTGLYKNTFRVWVTEDE